MVVEQGISEIIVDQASIFVHSLINDIDNIFSPFE